MNPAEQAWGQTKTECRNSQLPAITDRSGAADRLQSGLIIALLDCLFYFVDMAIRFSLSDQIADGVALLDRNRKGRCHLLIHADPVLLHCPAVCRQAVISYPMKDLRL